MKNLLEINDLKVTFPTDDGFVNAVDGVSLTVAPGETVAIVGESGSGKTMLCRALVGTLNRRGAYIQSGSIDFEGIDLVNASKKDWRSIRGHKIGYIPQSALAGPNPVMRIGAQLAEAVTQRGRKSKDEVRRRSLELLELVQIRRPEVVLKQYPYELSGGMKQRVMIACAIAQNPKLIVADEPTTGLDPMSRLTLWEEVKRLNAGGTTVLLTTQYLEEADQLADRIAIIDHGRIVRQGAPRELKAMVGSPTLSISVASSETDEARAILARFGDLRPTSEGTLGVGLARGAEDVASVIRALDEAGLKVRHLELDEPSLDDVFAEATGYRLEGADAANKPAETEVVPEAKKSRRGRK